VGQVLKQHAGKMGEWQGYVGSFVTRALIFYVIKEAVKRSTNCNSLSETHLALRVFISFKNAIWFFLLSPNI